ncbi:ATP-binding protein [Amycolatopsis keratiniphila]|uniref:LuxR family transcriptional regulator n=1 Tax=Amycolatopsis keratiniphila TaxID=129921 RepID=R4T3X6_9PSEU|nr:AAA family ATPase [Amycolatopsis keratiniphila]AGM07121.1 LuxR family transcriptional regulator [Amycolatopsis keratiniphila]
MIDADHALKSGTGLIGRSGLEREIRDALRLTGTGKGTALLLVGKYGVGKSRLAASAAEMAVAAGMAWGQGRGSVIGRSVALRPLTEAVLSLVRGTDHLDPDALRSHQPALAAVLPEYAGELEQPNPSPVLLGEAVLRLLSRIARGRGCLLVLEDLHEADYETLAVVEYLIDNLRREPVLLVATIGSEPGAVALALADAVATRRSGRFLPVPPLGYPDTRRLVCSHLGVESVPTAVADIVWLGSSGIPLLIRAITVDLAKSGYLGIDESDTRWSASRTDEAPGELVKALERWSATLDPVTLDLLLLAAVLGRRYSPTVLGAATGLEAGEIRNRLSGLLRRKAYAPGRQSGTRLPILHPLLITALLAQLSPARRAELARRVADAVEAAHPGLPGLWCPAAAALRSRAGEPVAASRLFAEEARRQLVEARLSAAMDLADRAVLLPARDSPEGRAAAWDVRLDALVEAGLADRAMGLAGSVDELVRRLPGSGQAKLHLRLADAAWQTGRTRVASALVKRAKTALGDESGASGYVRAELSEVRFALDAAAPGRLRQLSGTVGRLIAAAGAADLPETACRGWPLLGRLLSLHDPARARECLAHAVAVAVHHHRPLDELRALLYLRSWEAMTTGDVDELRLVVERAGDKGAESLRHRGTLTLALVAVLRGEFAAAEELLDRLQADSTRLRLHRLTQQALLIRTVLAGHRGRTAELATANFALRAQGGFQPQHSGWLHGLSGAFCALLTEDRDRAMRELDLAARAKVVSLSVPHHSGKHGLSLLLRALRGDLDLAGWDAATADPAHHLRWDRQFAAFARAVLLGRRGDRAEAEVAVADAVTLGDPYPNARFLGLRLVGEAALADGWGAPVRWLRAAEKHFDGLAVAQAAGSLVRQAGARAGATVLPPEVQAAGVTAREYEVLRLLVDRLSNREIADLLHLSHRTVERHVSSLIAKTGLAGRIELGRFAITAGVVRITPAPVRVPTAPDGRSFR